MWKTRNKYHNQDTDRPDLGERNTLPSITVPGMVIPLSDLLERFRMGSTANVKQGVFTDNPEFASVATMTPLEKAEKAMELRTAVVAARQELFDRNEERKRVKAAAVRAAAASVPPTVIDPLVSDDSKASV